MDISKEYIKMCEKASKELGSVGKYKKASGENSVMTTDYGEWFYWKRHATGVRNEIWLPRQDQLQEMISNIPFAHDWYRMLKSFTSFCGKLNANPINYVKSMEQLWLAFVMKEKYQKVWTGTDWEVNDGSYERD